MTTTSDLRLPGTKAGKRLLTETWTFESEHEYEASLLAILAIEDEAATPTDTGLREALIEAAGRAHMFARHDMTGRLRDAYAFDECPHDRCPKWTAALSGPHDGEEGAG